VPTARLLGIFNYGPDNQLAFSIVARMIKLAHGTGAEFRVEIKVVGRLAEGQPGTRGPVRRVSRRGRTPQVFGYAGFFRFTQWLYKEFLMRSLSKLVSAAVTLALLAGVAPAQTEPSDRELVKLRVELASAQSALAETRQALEKSQAEQAAAKAKLAEITVTGEALRKELESEKAEHGKAVAKLNAVIKNSVARLEATNREADSIRTESKTAAANLVLTTKENAETKAELSTAQQTLALQPALPCTVVVTLPADAQLTFDDSPTTSTGGRRVFLSPVLSVGPTFCYSLKAEVMRDGKAVTMQKHIEVRAGERIETSLTLPAPASIGQP
jgi:uncharacterized protein (TIGR03000 family)